MKDTNFASLSVLGFKDRYIITDQGLIIDTANQSQLQPNKKGEYRLVTDEGKTVYRAIKPLYRQVFGVEFAVDTIEDLCGEQWKPIDTKGKYYISSYGRVKSYQGRNARILNPYTNQKGYLRVDINAESRRTYLVHQLVALAFIPNDNPIVNNTVDHIDLNKRNNNMQNLRWMSRAENIRAYQIQKQGLKNECDESQSKDYTG